MDSQQTTHREEEFSYPPFKPKKGSLFISLLIAVVVFCFVASALAIVLTANVELIEENVDKLLIRLMITFVGALAASIAAALLFKRFVKKKEKAEWEQAKTKAEEEFSRKQQEQLLQAEWQRKSQQAQQEYKQNFEICEFCGGDLVSKINENEQYSSFVKTDYTLKKTGYNEYSVKENGFNAKHLTGTRKIFCPKCGYRIISDFQATDVGGKFGYSRKYLSHEIYVDVDSPISKEQIEQGRLYTNINKLS